jgi:hypothetical protein
MMMHGLANVKCRALYLRIFHISLVLLISALCEQDETHLADRSWTTIPKIASNNENLGKRFFERTCFMSIAFYPHYWQSPNGLIHTLALSIRAESLLRKRPKIPEECSDPQSSDCKYKNQ